ncbi:extracellular solute-binding protein [Paenibacillus sp. GYB004]|uniref:ABC transporter substrate-binding protein n=1 Tax=Paenibacillus sp. GYB004 TaxID=2994393 RepID=UPI002F96105B
MPKTIVLTTVSIVVAAALLSACGKKEPATDEANQQQQLKPVTLRFFTGDKDYEQRFKNEIADKVKQKYPHISFEFIGLQAGKQFQDLIVAGEAPDIYYQGLPALNVELVDKNMQYDLTEMIKKTGFDLNRIDPAYLDIIRTASETYGGSYFGLPVTAYTPVLYYNKDLFDKFSTPYPKDGMTWDEAYELARRLTRVEDGIQYRGMTMNFMYLFDNNQIAAPYFRPAEDRANLNSDGWRTIFNTLGRFYQIPMSQPIGARSRVLEVGEFTKNRISAMHADVTAAMESFPDDFTNWDMVSLPTMAEAPATNAQLNPRFYYIMSSSKYKEEAFKVIDFVLSDEMQMSASKAGKATVLKNEEIRKAFGQESAKLKGKNTQSFYHNKPVKMSPARDSKLVTVPAVTPVNNAFNAFIQGTKDVNTALRDADEELNKAIEQAKQAKSAK